MIQSLMSPSFICFMAGGVLALMISLNGQLAAGSNALLSSLVAHGVGAAFGMVLILFSKKLRKSNWGFAKRMLKASTRPTLETWSWFGGVLGAFVVICSSFAVNSKLGTTGTVAQLILGQIVLGLIIDQWGLFKMPVHKAQLKQVLQVLLIASGTALIIFGAR